MKRRTFIAALGGAAAWPVVARAQQPERMRRIGVLMAIAESDSDAKPRIAAFLKGLRDHGWNEGENIHIEYRWGAGRRELIHQFAQELVALKPDAILANGTPVVAQLSPLTRSIPIVCAMVVDPVGFGFIESWSRPGTNITGFSYIDAELIGKWMTLLKDAAPSTHRAALLYNPKINPWYNNFLREIAAAPQQVAMQLVPTIIETVDDLQASIPVLARTPGTGLINAPDIFLTGHFRELVALAEANRLPSISVYRQFAVDGGLMSYGPDLPDIFRLSADYIDRVLKGTNPATLPMQRPTKFDFTINQRAADTLGLILPPVLLASADEVIE
jgi:putative tryptophan/tyrosine transport system substrate-binding protein